MIRFLKNSTNEIVVTLTENSTVSNPIYLFMFKNQTSFVEYYFIANDISSHKERFNKFSVIEQINPNTLNGEVLLGFNGRYDYEIYQTSVVSIGILDNATDAIPFITKTVEVGLVNVVMTVIDYDEYETENLTNIVYEPNV